MAIRYIYSNNSIYMADNSNAVIKWLTNNPDYHAEQCGTDGC